MSSTLNVEELASYVADISDSELLEDVSHLVDLNIVTRAISATDNGYTSKLPTSSLTNIKNAFKVYRDELAKRVFNSDFEYDSRLTLLGEYYNCVKTIRSLSKYLNRLSPVIKEDYGRHYTDLLTNRSKSNFKQTTVQEV